MPPSKNFRKVVRLVFAAVLACTTFFHTHALGPDEYRVCGEHATTAEDLYNEIRVGNCKAVDFYNPLSKDEVSQLANELRQHEDGVKSIKLTSTVMHREHEVRGGDGMHSLAPVLAELVRKGCAKIELHDAWVSDHGVATLVDNLLPALRDVPPGRVVHPSHVGRPHAAIALGLIENRITDAGAEKLAELLPYLSVLDLSYNAISDKGALSFRAGMASSYVHKLDLSSNPITAAAKAELRSEKPWLDLGPATHFRGHGAVDDNSLPTTSLTGNHEEDWKISPSAAIDVLQATNIGGLKSSAARILRGMAKRNSPALAYVYKSFKDGKGEKKLDALARRLMELLVGQGHDL